MSTSDQDQAAVSADRMKADLPAGLPDVATLTRMANEFFRVQPEPNSVIAAPYSPDAGDLTPTFETRLPQFGMPSSSMPAIPSAGGIPLASETPAMTELSPFMVGPAAAMALPAATPLPQAGMAPTQATPFTTLSSSPQPQFGATFPSFETGVPAIPPLPPLRTGDGAGSVLPAPSDFYFLEYAGGLSGSELAPRQEMFPNQGIALNQGIAPAQGIASAPGIAPKQDATSTKFSSRPERSVVEGPAVFPPSPFSLPMPEFDQALFPSFEAPVPRLPALPPLLNEDDARAVLTDSSRFYFLDGDGLLATSTHTPATGPRDATAGDLKLPRQQFDIGSVRRDFPILREEVNGHPLIWLDNAATTQKPQSVIDRISYFYEHENSNIHRAAHELAARATDAYEDARSKVAHFLNASSSKEIVFARGATEAINLVAQAWGRRHINKGDEIVITWIEHHANIVPWQMLCAEKGACLRVAPVDDDGQVLLDEYEKLLSPKTRLVSFTQVSNALGTVTPAHQMVQMAHRYGARVLLDGAQAVSHMPIDVQSLDCDFYVFSGHKVFAPTGIGVLYGKPEVLAETPPWQGGGNMIIDVTFEKTTYQPPPGRFEAGTGNIADAVGLGAAIDYLEHLGMPNVARHEHELMVYATREMMRVPGLRIIGTAKEKAGVLSFVLDGYRTEEVGAALNREGIAVRSGHHCAQPTLRRFGLETTVRPSLAVYNSYEDIDAMVTALFRLKRQGV
jgi:cysteine desulfurase / selenocysteine lyase